MKTAYIIKPFETTEYLIRCINSLYRQVSDNFYVILAENNFNEDIEKYLDNKNDVIRISDRSETYEEKIHSAFGLIPDDTDYVMLISVDTVISPVAAIEFEEHSGSRIIIPLFVLNNNGTFSRFSYDTDDLNDIMGAFGSSDIVISMELLKDIDVTLLFDNAYFHLFIADILQSENIEEKSQCKKVCCYVNERSKSPENIDFIEYPDYAIHILKKYIRSSDSQNRIKFYEKYINILTHCLSDSELDNNKKILAFKILQQLSCLVKDDCILNKINELHISCDAESIMNMDFYGYTAFRRELFDRCDHESSVMMISNTIDKCLADQRKSVNSIDNEMRSIKNEIAPQKKAVTDLSADIKILKNSVDTYRNSTDNAVNEISRLKNDIAALTKNIHYLSQSVAKITNGSAPAEISDPVYVIPQMFREGKLGFSVIIRSFKAWISFKSVKKNKNK